MKRNHIYLIIFFLVSIFIYLSIKESGINDTIEEETSGSGATIRSENDPLGNKSAKRPTPPSLSNPKTEIPPIPKEVPEIPQTPPEVPFEKPEIPKEIPERPLTIPTVPIQK